MHDKMSVSAASKAVRLDVLALTGLRFVAAMMVLVGHAAPVIPVSQPKVSNFLGQLAPTAMAVFFTVSGFVMLDYGRQISDRTPGAIRNFAVARIARLWPMYLVTLAAAVVWTSRTELIASLSCSLSYVDLMRAAGRASRQMSAKS
jgi:peptidoglycan/LPS O-acetylase OafA/YrhL